MIFHQKQRGFTLIELLVVISIIGLLSSVVMASLNSASEKTRIAAGITFAEHTYQAFGAEALGAWHFDEVSGNAIDQSQNNRPMIPATAPLSRSSNTPTGSGYSFNLQGSNAARAALPTTIVTNLSASAWVYWDVDAFPSGASAWGNVIGTNDVRWGGVLSPLVMYNINGVMHCYMYRQPVVGATLPYVEIDLTFTGVSTRKWHHIACSIDSQSRKMTAYLDGKLVATSPAHTSVIPEAHVNVIGAGGVIAGKATPNNISAFIDDVAVYSYSLLAGDVELLYAQGLPNHITASAGEVHTK
jgi:prepilin-type N-terminal cleavage/methylation domain-containing protein